MLTAGQATDRPQAELMLEGVATQALIADKGYDCDSLRAWCIARCITPVIPPRRNRREPQAIDRNLYEDRNKVERFFALMKQARRVATRYDKTASSFLSFCHLVAALVLLR